MRKIKSLRVFIWVFCILCFSVWCNGEDESVVAPMKKTEQDALFSAIQAFVGKWWNGSDLYPDPCGWTPIQGVSCDLYDGYWYVTQLTIGPIHDNSLSCAGNAEFSPHLFALKHLKSLSFFNCFVSPRRHPVSIPTQNWELFASNLLSLEFRSNPGLTGQVPVAFCGLKNLESLVLVENGVTGNLEPCLGTLLRLKRLNLAGNSITGKIPDSFGGLNSLLILDMSRNSLSGSMPLTFGGLTSLLKFDLSHNQIQGKIPEEVGNLNSLTLLDLSNNRLSGGLTKSLQNLHSLHELVLSNNPIGGDIMIVEWRYLMRLGALDLANTSLTGGIPESIADLKGLRFLGLNDNKLTGIVPVILANLPNVGALYLHGNNLTGELKFSDWFYGKMGNRFGAWDNPNLCYPVGLIGTRNVPFGVKECQKEMMKYEIHDDHQGNVEYDHVVSLEISVCGFSWFIFMIEVLIVMIFEFFKR